jgi:hypothetical protein
MTNWEPFYRAMFTGMFLISFECVWAIILAQPVLFDLTSVYFFSIISALSSDSLRRNRK